jgi:hypothetical protein
VSIEMQGLLHSRKYAFYVVGSCCILIHGPRSNDTTEDMCQHGIKTLMHRNALEVQLRDAHPLLPERFIAFLLSRFALITTGLRALALLEWHTPAVGIAVAIPVNLHHLGCCGVLWFRTNGTENIVEA